MKHVKSTHIGDTIRIRRPSKVFTDALGRTVWMSDVEPCELELATDSAASTDPYNSDGLLQQASLVEAADHQEYR